MKLKFMNSWKTNKLRPAANMENIYELNKTKKQK